MRNMEYTLGQNVVGACCNQYSSGDANSTGVQTPNSTPSNVLDFEELQNRCMGNIDLVQRVLKKFQNRFPEDMKEINDALSQGDGEHAARVAHRIKGTSASVSAKDLSQAANEVENIIRSGQDTNLLPHVDRLRAEWEKCLVEAEAFLSKSNNGATVSD